MTLYPNLKVSCRPKRRVLDPGGQMVYLARTGSLSAPDRNAQSSGQNPLPPEGRIRFNAADSYTFQNDQKSMSSDI